MARRAGQAVVSGRVYLRSERGRFVADVGEGAQSATDDIAKKIAAAAIALAATELKQRTGTYLRSIKPIRLSRTSAGAVATAPYAEALEKGARSHNIPNSFGRGEDFGFPEHRKNWEKGGEFFHPGNPAFRIMERAGAAVAAIAVSVIKNRMP